MLGQRANIIHEKPQRIVLSPFAFLQKTSPIIIEPLTLTKGETFPRTLLLTFLEESGYARADLVQVPGEYAMRGSLIDIFATTQSHPCRIDYFGDAIEAIRIFHELTQQTIGHAESITLYQACAFPFNKALFRKNFEATFHKSHHDYLFKIEHDIRFPGYEWLMPLFVKSMVNVWDIFPQSTVFCIEGDIDFDKALSKIQSFHSKYATQKLVLDWQLFYALPPRSVQFEKAPATKITKQPYKKKVLTPVIELIKGDFIVHRNHGVGQFEQLELVCVDNTMHECIKIIYAEQNRLFVPIEHFDLISRFGDASSDGTLDHLGTLGWQKRKAKTKERINELAKRIVEIAAKRKQIKVDPIIFNHTAYEAFCEGFPFHETHDQKRSINETLSDLASGGLMDRIICGDAGFGKTEVALRAAFAATSTGRQVVVLTPTTLLAKQHFDTFSERFKGFNVELVSRLVKPADLKKTIQNVEEGRTHILIGTHAVLSDKIKFSNLGLLIIDEEHRFGVVQKEKIKNAYKDVHILALSATPIPRTLQLSLSGLKDMSLIGTPPVERIPTKTYVGPIDSVRLEDILNQEYQRGGQVFYVTPRIEHIDSIMQTLPKDKRTAFLHGRMESEKVMSDFLRGDIDILVSTNVIEAGIDIQTANTIIIDRAHMFGLAQLYQLRGRVGRGNIRGIAYLTYPADQELSIDAQKRLSVIQNLDRLGIGCTIAVQDMDIRGYGNVIGKEQSGYVKDVGIELYQSLVEEAIDHCAQNKADEEDWLPEINLGISVLIPESYIPDESVRLSLYRQAASVDDVEAFGNELRDRFGPCPDEVRNLLNVIELKHICKKIGISKVERAPKGLIVQFYNNNAPPSVEAFLKTPWAMKHAKVIKDCRIFIEAKLSFLQVKKLCASFKIFEKNN